MKQVLKYVVHSPSDRVTVVMPFGAQILNVQVQYGQCVVWALCDLCQTPVPRLLAFYCTGGLLPDEPGTYLGTVQLQEGNYVLHAFEI